MSKRDARAQRARLQRASTILEHLQARAQERCGPLGHTLGDWTAAKKKHGQQAQKAMCTKCGEVVYVLPFHAHNREHPQVPALKGDILFQLCYSQGDLVGEV